MVARSKWFLTQTSDGLLGRIVAAGRNCSSERGLAASADLTESTVVLGQNNQYQWKLSALGNDCSKVQISSKARVDAGGPAYLTSSSSCSTRRLVVSHKVEGSMLQRFTLVPL